MRYAQLLIPPAVFLLALNLGTPSAFAQLGVSVDAGGVNVSVGTDGGGVSVGVGVGVGVGAGGIAGDIDAIVPDEVPMSQEEALEAVQSRKAVPLAPIIAELQNSNVQVVDARLLALKGILVYEVRVIAENGDVGELYFYARTGKRIATN